MHFIKLLTLLKPV